MALSLRQGLALIFAAGVVLLAALASNYRTRVVVTGALETVTIALPRQASTAPMFVAIEQGFFRDQGLHVVHQSHELGTQGLKSLLDHQADLTVVADTPFMFKAMAGERIAIVCAISTGRRTAAIVVAPGKGINSLAELAGHSVGLPLGTNMQFLLSLMLLQNRVPETSVKRVDLGPDQIVTALRSGKVDAVTAWQINLAQLQESAPSGTKFFFGEQLFRFRFHLVARRDYLEHHAHAVKKVVAALAAATQFMDQQPGAARSITARYTGIDLKTLARVYDPADFDIKLDQAILIALDDQSRWAIRSGLVTRTTVPDYIDYIYFDALQEVDPSAVTMIR
nr:ABC transporter substrate-binding protein [uncultured Duganella sp.]